jgi:hypothetical protein
MRRAILLAGLIAVAALGLFRDPVGGVSGVAHEAVRLHLRLTGSSVYEYHARFGRWPTRTDDLAKTSLPAVSPHWRYELDEGLIVVVWPTDWKPAPKDNADRVLAYYAKGLISERGRMWVCWGDLRIEYVETDALRAYLNEPGH